MYIGRIFCHVDKSQIVPHFRDFIILMNQKWNGIAPIFTSRSKGIAEEVSNLLALA